MWWDKRLRRGRLEVSEQRSQHTHVGSRGPAALLVPPALPLGQATWRSGAGSVTEAHHQRLVLGSGRDLCDVEHGSIVQVRDGSTVSTTDEQEDVL